MSQYCFHCMKPIDINAGVCPHCGQTPFGVNQVHQLKASIILQNRYLIGEAIGQGGFGITYIGLDTKLETPVAVKEYYPNGISNRNNTATDTVTVTSSENIYRHGKERFLLEARNLAKFKGNPGIVGVLDHFEENNTAYIVMDYIEGTTLKEWVETKGPFKADACFNMMKPIITVLEQMHSQKIVHRDISPDNIMRTPRGDLKLLDFGAAREVSGDKSISVMLKPGYAPYEQYRSNGDQGPWTDVYGFCATMYFCMTGKKPEASTDRMEDDLLKRPTELGVELSGAQESALMRGMAVRVRERYQSVSELKSALFENEKTLQRGISGEDDDQTRVELTNLTPCMENENKINEVGSDDNDHHISWKDIAICSLVAAVVVLVLLMVFPKKSKDDPAAEEAAVISTEPVQTAFPSAAPTFTPVPTETPTPTPVPVEGEHREYKTLAAGNNHTLRLYDDGTVTAVGLNQDGQCDVSGWTDVLAVAAGDRHTVGLRSNGTVVAVGYNGYNQCDVSGWMNIIAVAAGGNHTVGLRSDGTVVATGWTLHGQCDVSNWTNISAVSAGICHTVGLRMDGTVIAVGDNRYGQCEVSGWKNIIAVAAGNYHTVGLRADGSVVAAGDNRYNRCLVSDWKNIVDIAAGERHTVGLCADGTVVAVGDNDYKQCEVSGWTDIVSISAGWYHTVGLRSDGTTVAVGYNKHGQCNISEIINTALPASAFFPNSTADPLLFATEAVREPIAGKYYQVSGGARHTLALMADGTVKAIGDNGCGQCDTLAWRNIKKVSAGILNTVALSHDGHVYATGYNVNGQCNVSDWQNIVDVDTQHFHTIGLKQDGTLVATGASDYHACDVSSFHNIVNIAAGEYHNLGLSRDGRVYASGSNIYGESDVSAWTNVEAIDAGYNHSVALLADGSVLACGKNTDGQCNVGSWSDITMIAAGGDHTVGLKSDGTVIAVGLNSSG